MTVEELAERDARKRARQHEVYWTRRAAGLCVKCGKPAVSDRPCCPRCQKREDDRRHPPKPKLDPEALTRAVHELEEINNQRRAAGLPTLTYGQWKMQGGNP
jgi:predicted amidophosphoribosyltransferase